ncbi:hypothetical protein MPSI1_000244 [Malassezia psittaci]|uniref:CN hydrolase domain-containing protein n=1 Tax=Malassezia psittaci TaxID=1821823 RepID=A0AAF0F2X0_9BASI|nr:hypothetical protein MPSI1_000244 [Malassezia psittaci]
MDLDIPIKGEFVHSDNDRDEQNRLHVVLAQVYPNSSEQFVVMEALPKLEALTRKAAREGADVIIFPEYFLTGATHEAWHHARHSDAISGHDIAPWIEDIAAIAEQNQIGIVTGSVVQHRSFSLDGQKRNGLYNTTYFIDYKGVVKGIYTKRNLWHAERAILANATDETHSTEDQAASFVFETRRGLVVRAAMVMCWDLMFPEAFRRMLGPLEDGKHKSHLDKPGQWVGPDVVFAPTCWYADDSGDKALAWNPDCEMACLDALTVSRAMENECFVCMCNAAGPSRGKPSSPKGLGRSSCNAPLLGCSARIEHEHECLLYQTLDMKVLDTAREIFRVRYDMNDAASRSATRASDWGDDQQANSSFVIDTYSRDLPADHDTGFEENRVEPQSDKSSTGLDLPGHVAIISNEPQSPAQSVSSDADGEFEQIDSNPGSRYYDAEAAEERRQKGGMKKSAALTSTVSHVALLTSMRPETVLSERAVSAVVGLGTEVRYVNYLLFKGLSNAKNDGTENTSHPEISCPTLWRIYTYNTPGEYAERRAKRARHLEARALRKAERTQRREKSRSGWAAALVQPSDSSGPSESSDSDDSSASSSRRPPPEDWDPALQWCYNCAMSGHHWGDDCFLRRSNPTRPTGEPSPFSEIIASSGPFAKPSQANSIRGDRAKMSGATKTERSKRRRSEGSYLPRPSRLDNDQDEDTSDWFSRHQALKQFNDYDSPLSDRDTPRGRSRASHDRLNPTRRNSGRDRSFTPSRDNSFRQGKRFRSSPSPPSRLRKGRHAAQSAPNSPFRPRYRGGYS